MNNKKDRDTSAGASRAPEHIKDINCEVKNCSYNEEERYCTASKVNIGPCCANSTPETVCATFKPKSGSSKTGGSDRCEDGYQA